MSPRTALASLVLTLAPLVTGARADVHVVALDGSGLTTSINIAIDLAFDGDTILIKPGDYVPLGPFESEFIVLDKAVSLIGDEGGDVRVPAIRMEDISPGHDIVIRNLIVADPTVPLMGYDRATLDIRNVATTVIIEDCELQGVAGNAPADFGLPPFPGRPGLDVLNSFRIVASRCTIAGGTGYSTTNPFETEGSTGGAGFELTNGRVTLYHCAIVGGNGGTDSFGGSGGEPGAAGVMINSGQTVIMGGVVTGGDGGGGCVFPDLDDCGGGDGLRVVSTNPDVRAVGTTFVAGQGGVLGSPNGADTNVISGTLTTFPDEVGALLGSGVLREGEAGLIRFAGTPGLLARLFFAVNLDYAPLGGKKGTYLPQGVTLGPILLGTIPPSGLIDLPLVAPPLPAGVDGLITTWQGYTTTGSGLILTNPLELVVLDDTL